MAEGSAQTNDKTSDKIQDQVSLRIINLFDGNRLMCRFLKSYACFQNNLSILFRFCKDILSEFVALLY